METRPLNIAMVIRRAEPDAGGAEHYLAQLCRSLSTRGHVVTVLAARGREIDGTTLIRLGSSGLTRTAQYHRFCRNVTDHLSRTSYDVVHAFLPVPECSLYHAHAGIESLALRDGHLRKPTLGRQALAKFLNRINRKRKSFADVESMLFHAPKPPITICLSNRERDAAMQMFPEAKDRFVSLYSLPDDVDFHPDDVASRRKAMRKRLGLSESQTMFLFIGNDFSRKGLSTAIKALGRINDPLATLYVIGRGDTHRYSEIALKAGAAGRVLFVGMSHEVAEFLTAADALVLPSRFEPFGMVVIEALLMGVPPIVSAAAGSSEVIRHEQNGLIVESATDPQPWAEAMTRLTNRALRDNLASNCIADRERFSYQQHVDAIVGLYKKAAATR